MTHGISEQEWNDYLEGELPAEARDRVEAHLIACFACWEMYQRLARTTQALRVAGGEVRDALRLQDHQLHAGLHGVFTRLRAAQAGDASPVGDQIQLRLDALVAVMAPMCGSQTAHKALRAAAQDSPARSLEQVTHGNWQPFLESLTSIAAVMCGRTGASLVWESGQL